MRKFFTFSWLLVAAAGLGLVVQTIIHPPVTTTVVPPVMVEPIDRVLPVPTTTPGAKQPHKPAKMPRIPGARPTALYVPAIGATPIAVSQAQCGMDSGSLHPQEMLRACSYAADRPRFVLPGTHAKDVAVIAGHTWRTGDAAFNPLYNWRKEQPNLMVGDEVKVKTTASGKQCLAYEVRKFLTVAKSDLQGRSDVWGKKARPGVLVLVGCKQQSDGPSVKNVVWELRFTGVGSCN